MQVPRASRGARLSLALAALGSLTACLAPPPRESVVTPVGVVRAADPGTAEHYAGLLRELHPRVRAALPDALDRPTEVWVQDVLRRWRNEVHRKEAMGFTVLGRDLRPGRIHLRAKTPYPRWYLTHELVHALMGPSWRTLPGVLSEGICDWIAADLDTVLAPTIQTHRLLHASIFFGGLSYDLGYTHPDSGEERRTRVWYTYDPGPDPLSPEEVLRLDRLNFHDQEAVPVSHYGLGFLVVSRIAERHGLEHLHRLCVEAEQAGHDVVPLEWILAAAEIQGPRAWPEASRAMLGEQQLHEVARIVPGVFRDLPSIAFGGRFPELDGLQFLRHVDPRVTLADGSVIPLAEIEAVRAAVLTRRALSEAPEDNAPTRRALSEAPNNNAPYGQHSPAAPRSQLAEHSEAPASSGRGLETEH